MKYFISLFALLFCGSVLGAETMYLIEKNSEKDTNGQKLFVNNSKTISTASTSLLIIRNPASSVKTTVVKKIYISANLATTVYIRKNPGAAVTGSSSVTLNAPNISETVSASLTASTATAGNTPTSQGTLMYTHYIPAAGSVEIPLGELTIPAGYGLDIQGLGGASTIVNTNVILNEFYKSN